jgi:hypothetical protein
VTGGPRVPGPLPGTAVPTLSTPVRGPAPDRGRRGERSLPRHRAAEFLVLGAVGSGQDEGRSRLSRSKTLWPALRMTLPAPGRCMMLIAPFSVTVPWTKSRMTTKWLCSTLRLPPGASAPLRDMRHSPRTARRLLLFVQSDSRRRRAADYRFCLDPEASCRNRMSRGSRAGSTAAGRTTYESLAEWARRWPQGQARHPAMTVGYRPKGFPCTRSRISQPTR